MKHVTESTLICTLGGQPQIITFALDILLGRDGGIREVIVIHLTPPDGRIEAALQKLRAEFAANRYRDRPCRLRTLALEAHGRPLPAIQTEAEAEATRQTIHTLITGLKEAERTLHLCIAGGPRLMALMTLSVVTMHCGHQDKVWHIYTEPELLARARDGAVMHDESGEQVRLIRVPVVPWGAYFPALQALYQTPAEVLQAQTAWLDAADRQRGEQVLGRLSARQREVLGLLAAGQTPQDVAEALSISIRTVDSHKTAILAECRIAWGFPDDSWLDYHFLREKFGPLF
jgi:CRISPR-associated protein Csx14